MSLKNFLYLKGELSSLPEGAIFELDGPEGLHAAKVMRIAAGEQILLTDSSGNQAECEVKASTKQTLQLQLLELLPEPKPVKTRFVLVQALAKGGRDESAIETATELGVDAVIPWQADRSIVQWKADKAAKGQLKWESTVQAAVKQSRRRCIPQVHEVHNSKQLTTAITQAVASACQVFVLHESAAETLPQQMTALKNNGRQLPAEIWLVVGPEGGITPAEIAAFTKAGAKATLLGREILRASTAGSAALAYLAALTGRWG